MGDMDETTVQTLNLTYRKREILIAALLDYEQEALDYQQLDLYQEAGSLLDELGG